MEGHKHRTRNGEDSTSVDKHRAQNGADSTSVSKHRTQNGEDSSAGSITAALHDGVDHQFCLVLLFHRQLREQELAGGAREGVGQNLPEGFREQQHRGCGVGCETRGGEDSHSRDARHPHCGASVLESFACT